VGVAADPVQRPVRVQAQVVRALVDQPVEDPPHHRQQLVAGQPRRRGVAHPALLDGEGAVLEPARLDPVGHRKLILDRVAERPSAPVRAAGLIGHRRAEPAQPVQLVILGPDRTVDLVRPGPGVVVDRAPRVPLEVAGLAGGARSGVGRALRGAGEARAEGGGLRGDRLPGGPERGVGQRGGLHDRRRHPRTGGAKDAASEETRRADGFSHGSSQNLRSGPVRPGVPPAWCRNPPAASGPALESTIPAGPGRSPGRVYTSL
jgi:hypothetical protein